MSNDAKFLSSAGAVAACLIVDFLLLGKFSIEARRYGDSQPNHMWLWFVLFMLCIILSIPVVLRYYLRKADRWKANQREAERIAIEALAAAGKQKRTTHSDEPHR